MCVKCFKFHWWVSPVGLSNADLFVSISPPKNWPHRVTSRQHRTTLWKKFSLGPPPTNHNFQLRVGHFRWRREAQHSAMSSGRPARCARRDGNAALWLVGNLFKYELLWRKRSVALRYSWFRDKNGGWDSSLSPRQYLYQFWIDTLQWSGS